MPQDPVGCGGFPRLHKRAVALAESKLLSITAEGAGVSVLLDALVHVSQGSPGRDSGTSWEQRVRLVLREATVETAPALAALPLWLAGGALECEQGDSQGGAQEGADAAQEATDAALVAVPQAFAGEVCLHLWADTARLVVRGRGLSVEGQGEARFVERFGGRPVAAART